MLYKGSFYGQIQKQEVVVVVNIWAPSVSIVAFTQMTVVTVAVDGTGGGPVDMPDDYGPRQPSRGMFFTVDVL